MARYLVVKQDINNDLLTQPIFYVQDKIIAIIFIYFLLNNNQ